MKSVKNWVKKFLFNANRITGIERQSILLGEIRADQIRQRGKLGCLADAEFSVFSQWGEDGILSWLVDIIQPKSQRFVEFGVEDYRESNTRYLLMTRNWSGMIIDGSPQNIQSVKQDAIAYKHDLTAVCSFVTRENIAGLLRQNGFSGDLGVLSVDIDGVDYWVLDAISNQADIIVLEYNSAFGSACVSVPYDPAFARLEKHWAGIYWGASLPAFDHLLKSRGYAFVGSNRAGTNAFFVKQAHFAKIKKLLGEIKDWPCIMREARKQDGSLAYKTYAECWSDIADLDVVDVRTGKRMKVSQLED
jgi:hypothetical protein